MLASFWRRVVDQDLLALGVHDAVDSWLLGVTVCGIEAATVLQDGGNLVLGDVGDTTVGSGGVVVAAAVEAGEVGEASGLCPFLPLTVAVNTGRRSLLPGIVSTAGWSLVGVGLSLESATLSPDLPARGPAIEHLASQHRRTQYQNRQT